MVVDSILLQAECGPNDHRKDAPPFNETRFLKIISRYGQKTLWSILRDHRCRQQSAVLAEGKIPTQPGIRGPKPILKVSEQNYVNLGLLFRPLGAGPGGQWIPEPNQNQDKTYKYFSSLFINGRENLS